MMKPLNQSQVLVPFVVISFCFALMGTALVLTLFGRNHAVSYLIGLGLGTSNVSLLIYIGYRCLETAAGARKGLLLAFILKYLLVFGVLFGSLYYYRLPPVTMVAGVLTVLPVITAIFWWKSLR